MIVCSVVAAATALAADGSRPTIGSQVDDLRFKDIRDLTRSLHELGEGRTTVLIFTNTSCPIAQKYWLKRLEEAYPAQSGP